MNIVDLDKLCERFWDGNFMEIHKDDIPSIPSAWEMAREINIDADPELISLILEWLKKKANEYDEQIREI